MKNFYFQERNDGCENWNSINYSTGPIDIRLYGEECDIRVSIRYKWCFLLKEVIDITKEAWEFSEENIVEKTETSFIIKTNFKILKNYLDKTVVFG